MASTRSKSSSGSGKIDAQNENDTQFISLKMVKELISIQESSMKAFISTFVEATEKRLNSVIREVQDLKTSLQYTQDQVDKLTDLNQEIQKEVDSLKEKSDDLENRSRRNNLCFDGIEGSASENWSQTEAKVKQVLTDNLDLDAENIVIERAHRVGSRKPGKSRSIVAKFQIYKDREKIFRAKRKLKGS